MSVRQTSINLGLTLALVGGHDDFLDILRFYSIVSFITLQSSKIVRLLQCLRQPTQQLLTPAVSPRKYTPHINEA